MNRLYAFFLPLLLALQEARVGAPPEAVATPSRAAALAAALDGELQLAALGRPYEEWIALHPQAVCEEYRAGRQYVPQPVYTDRGYCFHCTWTEGAITNAVSFYPVLGESPACRLLRFSVWADAPGEVQDARRELNRLLTSHLGKGFRDRQGPGFGQRVWTTPELEVRSFAWSPESWQSVLRRDLDCCPPDADTETRRRLLASAAWKEEEEEEVLRVLGKRMGTLAVTASLRESGELLPIPGPGGFDVLEREKARRARLQELLRASFPEAAELLQKGSGVDKKELRAGLERLLEGAREAEGDDRAARLLAADYLAKGLHHDDYPTRESPPIVETIAGYRLHYDPPTDGELWEYRRDLLWEAWKAGSGEWSEEAFLELSDMGWSGEVDCFREVIERGKRFLAEAPDSPRAPAVLFDVAQAYETWWSLSRDAGEDYIVEDPERYQPGAEAALAASVAAYERLSGIEPEGELARAAQQRLLYLRLGIDTQERRFYCFNPC